MAGQEPKGALGAHKMVGGELVKAISRSGKYSAINRTDEILKVIDKEHGYQRSGAVSDEQIKALGRQFGVQYLCIAEISDVKGGSFYLDVRLVDVVTAKTINSATATSALKNNDEMMTVAQQVARELVSVDLGVGQSTQPVQQITAPPKYKPTSKSKLATTTFVDSRDGKSYKKVTIDRQTFMAENLNYQTGNSKCYGNDASNCAKYGRLYNWSMAKKACPAGWHLPSDAEWTTLTDYVGGSSTAGTKLKATSGWYNSNGVPMGNGTDDYEFSTLPGGYGGAYGNFDNVGSNGYWWSATERGADNAWYRSMYDDREYVYRDDRNKLGLFSVRCVQD
jgi:uncharacterized protein (TIGR02145 family)